MSDAALIDHMDAPVLVGDPDANAVHLNPAFEPLWAIAGHGALGTLFLLSGKVGEASNRVEPLSEVLHEQPLARIFHVVLLSKGERISPDELRENLSLIDEASLFLLPLESPKPPAALLRGLFARVVPNIKRRGLLTPRVRGAFEEMKIIQFESASPTSAWSTSSSTTPGQAR